MKETPSEQNSKDWAERSTKVFLTLVFLGGVGLFILLTGPDRLLSTVETWSLGDFLLLGLATHRLGRLVSHDRVMEPLRSPFTKTVPDLSGAGDTVIPRGEGALKSLGQLISCPICAGTWIAAGLVALLVWFPGPARIFLWMTGAVALAEVIFSLVEAFTWTGHLTRTIMGTYCIERERSKRSENNNPPGE